MVKKKVMAKGKEPIVITTNSVTDAKLTAIVNVSQAICDIAKALNAVTTRVVISDCVFTTTESAIEIKTAD
jgi:hypothetical protein